VDHWPHPRQRTAARAQQELAFRIVPVYPAMRAAIEWFRANGYAPQGSA